MLEKAVVADEDSFNLSAAAEAFGSGIAIGIAVVGIFIEYDDEQAVAARFEIGALEQRRELGFKPIVKRSGVGVVRVVITVGSEVRESGQGVIL